MKTSFDSIQHVRTTGNLLISAIQNARNATTPGIVGAAIEAPVRHRLEQILPRGIAVGQGCIIDSFGRTSRQMDVILYERDLCPVFEVNNTPEATYFPCEGVIAAGEIKSVLTVDNLRDSFDKLTSVRNLERFWTTPNAASIQSKDTIYYRKYGSPIGIADVQNKNREKEAESREIYCFIIGGTSKLSTERLLSEFQTFGLNQGNANCPNALLILEKGWLHPCKLRIADEEIERVEYRMSFRTGCDVAFFETPLSFNYLISDVYTVYRKHKTSELNAFDRYIKDANESSVPVTGRSMKYG